MSVPEALHPFDRIVSPRQAVRRTRRLPGSGQLLVSMGSVVEPSQIIGEAQQSGATRVLDAAALLRVAPPRVAELLQVAPGDPVEEGQLLAERGRFPRRRLVSPLTGTLSTIDERGRLILRALPHRTQVRALIGGTVVRALPGELVELEGVGALIQGIWGNGREDSGLLRLMVSSGDGSFPAALINAGLRGTLLVGGATVDGAVLEALHSVQVRGLILGSLDAALLPLARVLPFPLMLTEGFGSLPINGPTFSLLSQLDGREASLLAQDEAQRGHTRPELFVPLGGAAPEPFPPGPLSEGDRVRLLSAPHVGAVGRIVALAQDEHRFASEVSAAGCQLQLDSGESVVVPYTCVERLLA